MSILNFTSVYSVRIGFELLFELCHVVLAVPAVKELGGGFIGVWEHSDGFQALVVFVFATNFVADDARGCLECQTIPLRSLFTRRIQFIQYFWVILGWDFVELVFEFTLFLVVRFVDSADGIGALWVLAFIENPSCIQINGILNDISAAYLSFGYEHFQPAWWRDRSYRCTLNKRRILNYSSEAQFGLILRYFPTGWWAQWFGLEIHSLVVLKHFLLLKFDSLLLL